MNKSIVLAILISVVGIITVTPAQTWTVEQVTDNAEQDISPFVAAVSSGLMIVYTHNDGDDEAFFANNFSGSWTTSRITDNSEYDAAIDIAAVYNEQNAYISLAWQDTPDWEISCYSGSPGSWNTERITDDADFDYWPSLAIDEAGHIHITYYKDTGGDREIFYANNATGSWVAEQVTDNASSDDLPWLALDSDGNPNIIYTDGSNFLYTKKTTGIWTSPQMVASGVSGLSFPFLSIDTDDNCHVTYSKSDGLDLEIYYANNTTGSWQEAKVTSNNYPDLFPTLLVDPYQKVHIAYQSNDAADAEISYTNNLGGVWITNRVTDNDVDDVAVFGRYFTADAEGIGHIFFSNASDGDNEIYHTYSNSPIYSGVKEATPVSNPISISIDKGVFSSSLTVNYSLPRAGNVSLKVYDAAGRLVKTLVNDLRRQNEHSVDWDGTNNTGTRVNSGVYFCNLTFDGISIPQKVVLK